GGDLQGLSAHLEHDLQRAYLPDPIPRAPAQPDIQVRLQSSPLHAGHNGTSLGRTTDPGQPRTAGERTRTVCRLTGSAVRCITPHHYSLRRGAKARGCASRRTRTAATPSPARLRPARSPPSW